MSDFTRKRETGYKYSSGQSQENQETSFFFFWSLAEKSFRPQSRLRDRPPYKSGQFAVNNVTFYVQLNRENHSFMDQRQLSSFQLKLLHHSVARGKKERYLIKHCTKDYRYRIQQTSAQQNVRCVTEIKCSSILDFQNKPYGFAIQLISRVTNIIFFGDIYSFVLKLGHSECHH